MSDGKSGDTYHISTNSIISIRDLVEKICNKLNVSFDEHVTVVGERMGKDAAYHLDSTKIRHELDWVDKINLDIGIDECISWVKSNLDTLRSEPDAYVHKP